MLHGLPDLICLGASMLCLQPFTVLAMRIVTCLSGARHQNRAVFSSDRVQADDQSRGNQLTACCCRSQGYAAHVRIASQDNVMQAEDFDEILSFGTYPSAGQAAFQPHASLTAQANGSLSVKAAGLNLLPAGGESSIGSGKLLPKHA